MSKELEALERLRNTLLIEGYWQDVLQDVAVIENALKTLEIIKEKGVVVGMLQLKEVGLQEYNDFIGDKKLYLTQAEFNLLKEAL